MAPTNSRMRPNSLCHSSRKDRVTTEWFRKNPSSQAVQLLPERKPRKEPKFKVA